MAYHPNRASKGTRVRSHTRFPQQSLKRGTARTAQQSLKGGHTRLDLTRISPSRGSVTGGSDLTRRGGNVETRHCLARHWLELARHWLETPRCLARHWFGNPPRCLETANLPCWACLLRQSALLGLLFGAKLPLLVAPVWPSVACLAPICPALACLAAN